MRKYKKIDNFELNTLLGSEICTVEILDIPKYIVLKLGEERRIRKAQAILFLEWIEKTKEKISPEESEYLLEYL